MQLQQEIKRISQKLIQASRGISITRDTGWQPHVKELFKQSGYKVFPEISIDDFVSISYDIVEKRGLLEEIIDDIEISLLKINPKVAKILLEIAKSWLIALDLIQARGTPAIYEPSNRLYGHPKQKVNGSNQTILEAANKLLSYANAISKIELKFKPVSSENMKSELDFRLGMFFDPADKPTVKLVHGLGSDAAAGGNSLLIRQDAVFNDKDIEVYNAHEAQVHLAAELNGYNQPWCKWLEIISPRSEGIQEGIATFVEFVSDTTYSKRMKRIAWRVIAIDMIESQGFGFQEIFDWHKESCGMDNELAYNSTSRIFQGSLGKNDSRPFTRDLSYFKYMLITLKFFNVILAHKQSEKFIKQLVNGYVTFNDLPEMINLERKMILSAPKYVPEIFQLKNRNKLLKQIKKLNMLFKFKL